MKTMMSRIVGKMFNRECTRMYANAGLSRFRSQLSSLKFSFSSLRSLRWNPFASLKYRTDLFAACANQTIGGPGSADRLIGSSRAMH